MYRLPCKSAQSLLEVILAVAIFSLIAMVMASFVTGGFGGLTQAGDHTKAESLAQEGIEAIRAVRDRAWNELVPSSAIVSISNNQWIVSPGAGEVIDNKYTRTITLGDVCRNVSDEITPCPGVYTDVLSKHVDVSLTFEPRPGITNTVRRASYITNWDSVEWVQTNWSGGDRQSIWTDTTRYDSDDGNIDYNSMPGQITLVDTSIGTWIFASGAQVIDTTDTDFNAGTLNNTDISGTGDSGSVVLDQNLIWTQHSDSGLVTTVHLNDVDIVSSSDIWAVGNSGKILHSDGTNWQEFADMGNQSIFSIDMISFDDGWAAGDSGKIYHYNGVAWNEFVDTGFMAWRSIHMISAADGWLVGDSGKIYHYNGVNWTEFIDTGGENWYGVDMISSNDGWIVGQSGKILHFDGATWENVLSQISDTLRSIFMISIDDGWAVGDNGKIIHFSGNEWTEVSSPTSDHLQSVFMVSSDDGWAVGNNGVIIHYNGVSLEEVLSPVSNNMRAVEMVSFDNGWAVGENGTILQYGNFYLNAGTFLSRVFDSGEIITSWDQAYWTEVLPLGSDITIATRTGNTEIPDLTWSGFSAELTNANLSFLSSPSVRYLQYRATFTRGDSASETPALDDITIIYNMPTTQNLNDLSIISSSDIWAAGNSGKILHYNGESWSEFIDVGEDELYAIDMLSNTSGWIVGQNGAIYQYNGIAWLPAISPTNKNLNDIVIVDEDDGLAVGDNGTIIYYNGTSWSDVLSPTNVKLNALFMESVDDGWAVGENGIILVSDDGNWSEFVDTGDQVWHNIFMISPNDGWIVGDSGRIWHYDGIAWSEFIDTGSTNWRALYFILSNDGWAGGNNGELYHYDGNAWTAAPSPTTRRIKNIEMIDTADGWAVGDNGIILQLTTEGLYAQNGWLVSSAETMGDASPVQVIQWDEAIPTCSPSCAVRFQLRTAPDSSGSPGAWTLWYGADGSDTYFTVERGELVPAALNENQWVQYRVELSGDGENTPVLEHVRVNYK